MLADLEALIPSTIMAVMFVFLVRAILRAQNPRRRAAARAREAAAEAADPRIGAAARTAAQKKTQDAQEPSA